MAELIESPKIVAVRERLKAAASQLEYVLFLANGIKEIRAEIGNYADALMALQGSQLGFWHDDKGPYSRDVVLDCATVAVLQGFQLVGYEWGVIAGKFYGGKEGYLRLVRQLPGVSNVEYATFVPEPAGEGRAIVGGFVKWMRDGKRDSIEFFKTAEGDRRIPVRVNIRMTDDGILGKATRKMARAAYLKITGMKPLDAEDEDDNTIDSTATTAAPQESLPAPTQGELSAADHEYMQGARLDIERAESEQELNAIYATLKRKKPHLVDIAVPLCAARKAVLIKAKAAV